MAAVAPMAVRGSTQSRQFGRHPKNYKPPQNPHVEMPSVKELTGHIVKPPKIYNWIRQPFPHNKEDDKATRKRKRQLYVFQRTLPAPVPTAVLHGCHSRLGPENTFRRWWYADASERVLGRLAQDIALTIMGKHKPIYDKSMVLGDFVVVVNAEKVLMTGKKSLQKVYRHHTGFLGGLKETPVKRLLERKPIEVIRNAVYGQLPKNSLRVERMKLLRIFAGPLHPHTAEDLTPLPVWKEQARSPWLAPREKVVVKEPVMDFYDMEGKPFPELTTTLGDKISIEEAQAAIEAEEEVYRDESMIAPGQVGELPEVDWDWEKK